MLKKITAMVLAVVLFASMFAGCGKASEGNLYGDVDDKKALRILIDIGYGEERYSQKISDLNDFMLSLKETGGLESVVFEVLPEEGVERSSAITRIRTEMMAGGGPDVFITSCGINTDFSRTLFPFPEKVMASGLFLPLDEYMENNTEFTEWDKQQPVVLAAGRNYEGQQLIPLSYSFPVQTCLATNFTMPQTEKLLTWQDTLTDPTLSAVYDQFNDCVEFDEIFLVESKQREILEGYPQYLTNILGRLADYEKEELLFTEEELMQRLDEILALQEKAVYEPYSVYENAFLGRNSATQTLATTFMPMYSDDGGITATINNFAAVNRNTKYPEDAYRVIDILMRKYTQLSKRLYTDGICGHGFRSIPLHDDAFHKDSKFDFSYYFSDENYAALAEVKEQITAANFVTSLHYDFTLLLGEYKSEADPEIREALIHACYDTMQRKVRE